MVMTILKNDWAPLLEGEIKKSYYQQLRKVLLEEYQTKVIYPDQDDIYNALHFTAFNETKVVIIGQDPYHGPGQAHGLSFSVKPGVRIPPSLKNIYKEFQYFYKWILIISFVNQSIMKKDMQIHQVNP